MTLAVGLMVALMAAALGLLVSLALLALLCVVLPEGL